jgi:hypothetical protein
MYMYHFSTSSVAHVAPFASSRILTWAPQGTFPTNPWGGVEVAAAEWRGAEGGGVAWVETQEQDLRLALARTTTVVAPTSRYNRLNPEP